MHAVDFDEDLMKETLQSEFRVYCYVDKWKLGLLLLGLERSDYQQSRGVKLS